jgi:hypothetical protein
MDRAEVVRTLTELLTIAKVAMPDEVYAIDPRIARANALLANLQAGGALRVPKVEKRIPDELDKVIAMIEGRGTR